MHEVWYALHNITAKLDLSGLPTTSADENTLKIVFNFVLAVMGAVAVLTVVIAGFRFITSQGNPQQTTQARNAILYALIGLVIIIFAFSIVNFVVFKVS